MSKASFHSTAKGGRGKQRYNRATTKKLRRQRQFDRGEAKPAKRNKR